MDAGTLRADLVLGGGAVKGIGLVGAIAALTDAGYRPYRISGTSAGAIYGSLAAAGLTGDRFTRAALSLDFERSTDPVPLDRIPLFGPGLALLGDDGLYQGRYFHDWIAGLLEQEGVRTFADLALDDPSLPPERRYKLVVTCADVTLGRLVRLPWDYRAVYGLDPDRQSVADAVRASMSVPLLFRPATLTNPATGLRSTLVDGGFVSNFPIDSLDRTDGKQPRWPTFGITVLPDLPGADSTILPEWTGRITPKPLRLLERVLATSLVGHDQAYLHQPWVAARAILVDTTSVGFTDFSIDQAQTEELYDHGVEAAERFLKTWDWQAYLDRFRPGT
ncbi:MAG TPA: patatin-like phospholipase family protein [Pseudonocardia sp.]|jgi:NTE family protein